MAINGLAVDLRARGELPANDGVDAALARLLAALAREERYSATTFGHELAALRRALRAPVH